MTAIIWFCIDKLHKFFFFRNSLSLRFDIHQKSKKKNDSHQMLVMIRFNLVKIKFADL